MLALYPPCPPPFPPQLPTSVVDVSAALGVDEELEISPRGSELYAAVPFLSATDREAEISEAGAEVECFRVSVPLALSSPPVYPLGVLVGGPAAGPVRKAPPPVFVTKISEGLGAPVPLRRMRLLEKGGEAKDEEFQEPMEGGWGAVVKRGTGVTFVVLKTGIEAVGVLTLDEA